jgi:hypothetical protein
VFDVGRAGGEPDGLFLAVAAFGRRPFLFHPLVVVLRVDEALSLFGDYGLLGLDGVPLLLDCLHVPPLAQHHRVLLVEGLLVYELVLDGVDPVVCALALLRLALAHCLFYSVESGVGWIQSALVLLADLLVNEAAVFLEGETLVVVDGHLHLCLGGHQLLLVVELREVRVGQDLLDVYSPVGIELEHLANEVEALLAGCGHQLLPAALLDPPQQLEHLMA